MLAQFEVKELGVQAPKGNGHRAGRDGDPERAEHRTPITLLDVMPTQMKPQFALAEALGKVSPRPCERLRLRRSVGEGHGDSFLPNFSSRPSRRNRNHSSNPAGSRRL